MNTFYHNFNDKALVLLVQKSLTVLAVGVLKADGASAAVKIKGGHAGAAIEAGLVDTGMLDAVVHILSTQSVFQ